MIVVKNILPELSHIEEGEPPVFVTLQGRMGVVYELPVIDLEALGAESRAAALDRLIQALPPGMLLRVLSRAEVMSQAPEGSYRSEAVGQLGFLSRKVLLSLERQANDPLGPKALWDAIKRRRSSLTAQAQAFRQSLPQAELAALGAIPLSEANVRAELALPSSPLVKRVTEGRVGHANAVDCGDALTGILRVYRPGTRALTEANLASCLDRLPAPYEVSVTLSKLSKPEADLKLRSRLSRGQVVADSTGGARQAAQEKALEETSLHGASLCRVEVIVIVRRWDESTLRSDLSSARSVLSELGDTLIETVGAVPSYVCSRMGAKPHVTFLEEDRAAALYLPLFSYGEEPVQGRLAHRSLLLHRLDGSLHAYDHFDPRFLAYNALICGKTGSGKSVLANSLSSALLNDPQIRMIKIDVGGSYRKECESVGGQEVNFRLDAPSGINPFALLGSLGATNEVIEILSELLSALIREEGEKQVPKALRAQVEEALKHYAVNLKGKAASLDGFLAYSKDLPRRALLARWAQGGIFENALKEAHSPEPSAQRACPERRYQYFNFENILAAASRDFAEGVMAAVIAMTNLEMLRLGDRTKRAGGGAAGEAGSGGAGGFEERTSEKADSASAELGARAPRGILTSPQSASVTRLGGADAPKRLVLFIDETKFFIEKFSQFFLLTAANFRKFGHGVILMLQNIRDAEVTRPDGVLDRGLILNSPIRFFLQADTDERFLRDQFGLEDHHLQAVVTHPYRGKEYREAVLQDDTGTRVVRLYLTDEEYWRATSSKGDVEKLEGLRRAVPTLSVDEAIRCLAVSQGRGGS